MRLFALIASLILFCPLSLAHGDDGLAPPVTAFHLALADAAIEEASPSSGDPFAAGAWIGQVYGSGTLGLDHSGIYLLHAGVGYHVADRFSINLEGVFGHLNAGDDQGEDGGVIGFDLLLRWHLVTTDNWSFYIDGGAGLIWFNDEFPSRGTHQNFTPQLGLGFTLRLSDHARLMAGARWHHISNANKSGIDRNPGFDGVMFYGGIMFPF